MEPDFSVQMIEATVMIEQELGQGRKIIGTGFLISDTAAGGVPRVTLVTADHVLDEMSLSRVTVGFRMRLTEATWEYAPASLDIRDAQGRPLWTSHPARDIAAISIRVSPELASKAIPLAYLADDEASELNGVSPGGELLALGYPRGLSSNSAGFPILRSGRVASYPIQSSDASPTFLLDFAVFPGNSGGPVFQAASPQRRGGTGFIAGMLTQQVEVDRERMDIGIVTHARFIRETLDLIHGQPVALGVHIASVTAPAGVPAVASEALPAR